MSDESMEIINQAKSQARKESFRKFFGKNGKLIKIFAVITLLILIISVSLSALHNSRQIKFSKILHQSLINQQSGQIDKAKENLKTIYEASSAPKGVWSLAALRYSAIFFNEGKKDKSVEIYLEINDCRSCDSFTKDLAGLLAVKIWVSDKNEVKTDDLAEKIAEIENSAKILRYQIAEQRALLEIKKGNLDKSYQVFESIAKNPEASQALKIRASNGLKMLISKGFEPKTVNKK